jgi:hypothetical protein
MIRQSIVDRLASSKERLQAALIGGEDTHPHRTMISAQAAELAKLDDDARRAESEASANAASDQSALAESIAQNVVDSIAAALAMHPIPTLTTEDPMKKSGTIAAASALAAAQAKHEVSAGLFKEATARTASIKSRLSDVEAAGATIREQRLSGELSDREAAGLIVLNLEDAADLRKLLAAAEQEQNALVPNTTHIRLAETALDRATNVAKFDALTQRAKETESAFLAVVADVYQAGRAIGHSSMLGASWVPSKELLSMISRGEPPSKAQ